MKANLFKIILRDLTRMFALVIGVSNYSGESKLRPLDGVTNDILSMKDFLSKAGYKKPRELSNDAATASEIRRELKEIAKNDTIEKDDPIMIYFAGHGAKDEDIPGARVLCPYDFNPSIEKGISDVELASFINVIASKKGNNITVILDCCYSGPGITQSASQIGDKQIHSVVTYKISSKQTLDDQLETAFSNVGVSSHVLLAGCSRTEVGLERLGKGVFTDALIKALSTSQEGRMTYREVIENLCDLPDQHPQCIGINQDRYTFSTHTNHRKHDLYKAQTSKKSRLVYTLNAGGLSETTGQSKSSIHETKDRKPAVLFKVTHQSITLAYYAPDPVLQHLSGDDSTGSGFKLFTAEGVHKVKSVKLGKHRNIPVEIPSAGETSTALICMEGNPVFEFYHEEFTERWGISSCIVHCKVGSPQTPWDPIPTVLSGAADFYSYLNITPPALIQLSGVHIHCYELEECGDRNWVMEKRNGSQDLIKAGTLELYGEESGALGFEIVNDTGKDLYVALFYFDFGDLSITSYYEPGTAKDGYVDFSIPRKGKLAIGYGSSGWRPRAFRLRKGHSVDVGVLKLFASTRWVDFSDIKQTSPFTGYQRSNNHSQTYEMTKSPWGSIRVPVVHKRAKNDEP